jgi:Tfp pilus assembly protein PilF
MKGWEGWSGRYPDLAVALGLADAVGRARLPRLAVILAAGAFLAVLGVASSRQSLVWRNTVGLFQHALAATGRNWFVRLLLAAEFIENDQFERAEVMLQQSLADGAPPARIHVAMSALFDREHREEDALREIDVALAVEPDNPLMLLNRGIYLTQLRRDAEAVAVLQRVIALDTGHDAKQLDVARRTLATAQGRLGRSHEGLPQTPDADRVRVAPR